MSFIAQDFDNLNIITVLEGRTQAVIRDHFLKYDRAVRCRVKIITMDMFSPYYDLAKQLRFRISRLRLRLGKNSILGENQVNLPTIKRIVSRLFNT